MIYSKFVDFYMFECADGSFEYVVCFDGEDKNMVIKYKDDGKTVDSVEVIDDLEFVQMLKDKKDECNLKHIDSTPVYDGEFEEVIQYIVSTNCTDMREVERNYNRFIGLLLLKCAQNTSDPYIHTG